ncbi:MAG: recombinase family protein [Micromonosporaceae bacterium]|nr:recombinase family protein [Micromonosporaceae bacterium]
MNTIVWYGRTASAEGATQQLRYQYHACQRLLGDGKHFDHCYLDIGVGYRGPDQPGGTIAPKIVADLGLPRSGGLAQLLVDASSPDPDRRITRVICWDLARISRRSAVVAQVLDHLAARGVELDIASEGSATWGRR